jgi:hypothetical protein
MFRSKRKFSKEELAKHGSQIAPMVFIQSRELNDSIVAKAKQSGEDISDYGQLMNLCMTMFYLYVDRELFSKLGAESRDTVFDDIEESLLGMIKHNYKLSSDGLEEERQELLNTIGTLTPHAAQFFPENNESPKGTLVWEFDKLLGNIGLSPPSWLYANEVFVDLLPPVKRLLKGFYK